MNNLKSYLKLCDLLESKGIEYIYEGENYLVNDVTTKVQFTLYYNDSEEGYQIDLYDNNIDWDNLIELVRNYTAPKTNILTLKDLREVLEAGGYDYEENRQAIYFINGNYGVNVNKQSLRIQDTFNNKLYKNLKALIVELLEVNDIKITNENKAPYYIILQDNHIIWTQSLTRFINLDSEASESYGTVAEAQEIFNKRVKYQYLLSNFSEDVRKVLEELQERQEDFGIEINGTNNYTDLVLTQDIIEALTKEFKEKDLLDYILGKDGGYLTFGYGLFTDNIIESRYDWTDFQIE